MKVLLINGSPHVKGCTYTALKEVANQLERQEIQTEFWHIGTQPVRGCIGCRACKGKGYCVFKDNDVNSCIDAIHKADGLIIGSPVYYAGAAGSLRAFLDRVFYAASSFAGKPAAAIVNCRRGGASSAFEQLNKYFTISSMPVVTSQYWNSTHGYTPEEVQQDLEGMQTMRTLANNMAWLLKSIIAGQKTVMPPIPETPLRTNFIR